MKARKNIACGRGAYTCIYNTRRREGERTMKEKKNAWSRRFARRRAQKVSAPACAARAQHAIDACNTPEEGAYIRARAVHGVPGPAASLARSEYGFSSSLVPREREKSMFIYFRMFFFSFW